MAKTEASIMIDCPVEAVWNLITDVSKFTTWDTTVSEAKVTSTGPLGVGSTFELRTKMGKEPISLRVIQYEPNRRLVLEHTSGVPKGTISTYSFETIGGGKTRLTGTVDLKVSGFYKLLVPIVVSRLNKVGVESLNNVKRKLESEANPKAASLHS
jgi:uncharacterized protein YndB with AHSA1/START domain